MNILHSKIYGGDKPGTPLLVFHGLFGMLDNWGSFGKEMAEFFPVHLIDLRNHGKSFHSEEMSHDDLAHDIAHYMDFHHLEKANLLVRLKPSNDQRRVFLKLTDGGQQLYTDICSQVDQRYDQIGTLLSPEKLAQLTALLGDLIAIGQNGE